MSGRTKWSEIKRREEARLRDNPGAKQQYDEVRRSLPPVVQLAEVREHFKRTQQELARGMSVSQARVSSIERANDLNVSTLDAYIAALGGRLVLLAEFGDEAFDLFLPAVSQRDDIEFLERVEENLAAINDDVKARTHPVEPA